MWILLSFLLSTFGQAAPICQNVKPNSSFLQVEQELELRIQKFANAKGVAERADAMLEKLIAAKSPVIADWLNKPELKDKSDADIVRAWRLYFGKNFLLGKYPQGDAALDKKLEALVDGVLLLGQKKEFVVRLEALFLRAQKGALEVLKKMPPTEQAKASARVQAIRLYWPKKLRDARNNANPLDLIDWGIAYDPAANAINIGLRALAYPNDDTLLAVLAHEIGHSVDSCRWPVFLGGAWPFQKVGDCLRSETSVGAKRRDDSRLDGFVKEGKLSSDFAAVLKENPTCNKLNYPPIGTQADQLPEAFADWFSAEVMAGEKIKNIGALRSDLCEQRTLSAGSSYPENNLRLERIYFSQPKLLALGGAIPNAKVGQYCPWP